MSYNGIGLQTPRGSGTSGYVQKNLADKKKEGFRQKREREAAESERREFRAKQAKVRKEYSGEIQDHNKKRVIEVKCQELRDKLEDEDLPDDVIDSRVAKLRESLKQPEAEAPSEPKPKESSQEAKPESSQKRSQETKPQEASQKPTQEAKPESSQKASQEAKQQDTQDAKPKESQPSPEQKPAPLSLLYKPRYGDR